MGPQPISSRFVHRLQFYDTDEFLDEVVASFFLEGLTRGGAAFGIVTAAHRAGILRVLASRGFDAGPAMSEGRLQFHGAEETLARLRGGEGITERHLAEVIGNAVAEVERRFGAVHLFGEMVDLLAASGNVPNAILLEDLWNRSGGERTLNVLCAYHAHPLDAEAVRDLVHAHSETLPGESDVAGRVALLEARNAELAAEIGRRERTELGLRRAERGLALLARASDVLARSLEWDATLQSVIGLTIPDLADFGFFDVVMDDGEVLRVPRARDPGRQRMLEGSRWTRSERTDVNVCALSSGQSAFHPFIDGGWRREVALSPEHLAAMEALTFGSMISVPLRSRGELIGSLTLFYDEGGRRYGEADLALAEELARRAAAAVENARLYRRLREADRRKDEFLAMLAHELRNPLAPMTNAIWLLRNPDLPASSAGRAKEVLERQTRHLAGLVDDLLDVSRISRGKVELKREPLDLASLVRELEAEMRQTCESAGVSFRCDLPDAVCPVLGDAIRLTQVLGNLVGNAAKFSRTGGSVQVGLASDGDGWILAVTDDGVGIEPALLDQVFEPFVQAGRSFAGGRGGLGLGLAVVKGMVELHGGSVEAHSDGEGKGTTFLVRLPGSSRPLPAAQAHPRAPEVPGRPMRVLVVDDHRDGAETLEDLLAANGHEVRAVHSGTAALAALPSFRPDVVLCDLGLPDLDGFAVADAVSRDPANRGIRLVAISGYGTERDRARSAASGFEAHLTKPVDPATLLRMLAS